jgi:hypothetical protein
VSAEELSDVLTFSLPFITLCGGEYVPRDDKRLVQAYSHEEVFFSCRCENMERVDGQRRRGGCVGGGMGALLVAYVAMRWRAATINPIAACEAAEQQVSHLHQSWMNTPLAAAEALRQMWEAEMLDPGAEQHILHVSSDARRCCAISDERCDGLRRSVAPFALFLASLRQSVELPRRAHLRRKGPNAQAPRVVVVGGGPAGLSATLLAHRAGADVTVIERRTHYTRPVWFDMQPPPAMEEEGEEEWKEDTSAQTLLRAWGFFALEPRVVIDPSGVMTVQCRVLEAFLALAASLLHTSRRDVYCAVH